MMSGDTVHTLVTSDGGGYQNFQTRIMYVPCQWHTSSMLGVLMKIQASWLTTISTSIFLSSPYQVCVVQACSADASGSQDDRFHTHPPPHRSRPPYGRGTSHVRANIGQLGTACQDKLATQSPSLVCAQVPTHIIWDLLVPECDQGCSFPVVNRPNAVMQFFREAVRNNSLIQGAWIIMTECDYLWMQPVTVSGKGERCRLRHTSPA